MELRQEQKRHIEEIIRDMECPKDFECYKSGFANVCKAKNGAIESLLECSEKHPEMCQFSLPYGDGYFCECPFRHYIAKGFCI
jgi:hypothetical protein